MGGFSGAGMRECEPCARDCELGDEFRAAEVLAARRLW